MRESEPEVAGAAETAKYELLAPEPLEVGGLPCDHAILVTHPTSSRAPDRWRCASVKSRAICPATKMQMPVTGAM